jgi:hypothetical protein
MDISVKSTERCRKLGKQGLFVIGHMRSGTTVLQNALNHSQDIQLFGEANFHRDQCSPDFRTRFNKWHESLGNQPTKSTHCPAVFDGDASWSDYLIELARTYRWVGEKIVVNPGEGSVQVDALMNFMAANFYRGHFIFCFRNPLDVMISVQKMTTYQGAKIADMRLAMISYLSVLRLYLTMVRVFPNVHVVFHEDPSDACFDAIGQRLRVDLRHIANYYQTERINPHSLEELPEKYRSRTAELDRLYINLRERASGGFVLPQLEQNRYNVAPSHPTPLGGLYNATEILLRDLTVAVNDTEQTERIVRYGVS